MTGGARPRHGGATDSAADGDRPRAEGTAAERAAPRPVDRLLAAYWVLAATALLFPHRPAAWPVLVLVHAAAVALALRLGPAGALTARLSVGAPRLARGFADWYPLLLIPLLYSELPLLNRAVFDGAYFDPLILEIEQAVFAAQPSRDWARAFPVRWLSEVLHGAYLSYYLIIYVPPLLLFLGGRRAAFRQMVLTVMLTFTAHYLFFIFFPVQGPRYLFPPPAGGIESGSLYQLTHALLQAGSSQGAAFPSSHVGVAVAQTIACARLLPVLAPVVGLLAAGLAVGAVYGGFHYAIDAVVGALLGAGMAALAARVGERAHPRHDEG